eukprot:6159778-Pyramimonas_sp.AAC.1
MVLQKVWKRSSLPLRRSLVESKLPRALPAGCFAKAELRRLAGFQAAFLRRVFHIQPSFVSGTSSAAVLQRAGFEAASVQVRLRQL